MDRRVVVLIGSLAADPAVTATAVFFSSSHHLTQHLIFAVRPNTAPGGFRCFFKRDYFVE